MEGRHARTFPVGTLLSVDRIYYRGLKPHACQRLSKGPVARSVRSRGTVWRVQPP